MAVEEAEWDVDGDVWAAAEIPRGYSGASTTTENRKLHHDAALKR
jgi:hypothetical protein